MIGTVQQRDFVNNNEESSHEFIKKEKAFTQAFVYTLSVFFFNKCIDFIKGFNFVLAFCEFDVISRYHCFRFE